MPSSSVSPCVSAVTARVSQCQVAAVSARFCVPECNRMWGICSRAVVSNVFFMCGLNSVSMSIRLSAMIISFVLN